MAARRPPGRFTRPPGGLVLDGGEHRLALELRLSLALRLELPLLVGIVLDLLAEGDLDGEERGDCDRGDHHYPGNEDADGRGAWGAKYFRTG